MQVGITDKAGRVDFLFEWMSDFRYRLIGGRWESCCNERDVRDKRHKVRAEGVGEEEARRPSPEATAGFT